ncbi:hypothetical protein [Virgisporangium aurantiacum]|uniref:Uncharacterized protein n=1 Tax=Virgisporangium aurantiacum TaxID=175570 RepID=A0A8J3Z9M8_9ACTN|nr:hypothetical protein [Virgisporangium aurantiacum]GIJ58912.1 hypothetical protein Vau01_064280 [Virgisporangium aurantiacum]
MTSRWSSTDPVRRTAFLCVGGVVVLLLGYLAVQAVRGERAGDPSPPPPPTVVAEPPADVEVNPPPGHEQDDRAPVGPGGSVSVPPRPGGTPALPLSADQMAAAYEHAMSFVEVFANARWDEPVDARIAKIRPFVAPAALDLVFSRYQQIRPSEENQETCTYRMAAARWLIMADKQGTLLVEGTRSVEAAGTSRNESLVFAITLTRETGAWLVTTVRDPREGDSGGR